MIVGKACFAMNRKKGLVYMKIQLTLRVIKRIDLRLGMEWFGGGLAKELVRRRVLDDKASRDRLKDIDCMR